MKKIKLFTSIGTVASLGAIVPIAATSCSKSEDKNITVDVVRCPEKVYDQIDDSHVTPGSFSAAIIHLAQSIIINPTCDGSPVDSISKVDVISSDESILTGAPATIEGYGTSNYMIVLDGKSPGKAILTLKVTAKVNGK